MKVVFDHKKAAAENIYTFHFWPEQPLRYVAGQFIELYLPHQKADDRGIKRWFTLSSSPSEELLSITTKFSPLKSSSFKSTLQNLSPGVKLKMQPPMGDFVLPKDPSIPLLFVAGGIGCTPYRSMIKYLQDTGESRDITLLYAANSDKEIAFKDVFVKLGDNFRPLVGEHLTAQKILNQAIDSHYIYLSGPEPMVEDLDKEIKKAGFDPNHIRTDFFPNYQSI